MKLIGILSDTHSCWDDRFATHLAGCDEIWHAGDVGDISVLRRLAELTPVVRAVSGNADHGEVCRACPQVQSFTTDGVRVVMTHIGGYPGKYAPGIRPLLRRDKPQIWISGHSHILKVMYDKDFEVLHINPGAAGYQGWQTVRTLLRLRIDAGDIKDLEVIELGKLKIDPERK